MEKGLKFSEVKLNRGDLEDYSSDSLVKELIKRNKTFYVELKPYETNINLDFTNKDINVIIIKRNGKQYE